MGGLCDLALGPKNEKNRCNDFVFLLHFSYLCSFKLNCIVAYDFVQGSDFEIKIRRSGQSKTRITILL